MQLEQMDRFHGLLKLTPFVSAADSSDTLVEDRRFKVCVLRSKEAL